MKPLDKTCSFDELTTQSGDELMRVKTWIARLLAIVVAASLAACKPITLTGDPAAEATAKAGYDDIAAGRAAAFHARLTPEAAQVVTPAQVLALRAYASTTPPKQQRLVGVDYASDATGLQTQNLVYELNYPGFSVLYQVRLKRPGKTAPWGIEAANLNRATEAELAKGRFNLVDRSPAQWSFLAATILSPLLMLSALVAVVRAPGLKRKWLWGLLALAGLGTATMNWTTGAAAFQPIAVNLIGAGVVKQGFSGFFPWTLKFTLPVGAVIAHWRAAKARRDAKQPLDETVAGA